MLEVKNLSKAYGDLQVLEDVNFTAAGEAIVVVGQSGMGKSSLLRIIAGLLDQDQGQIFLNGKKILGPKRKLVPGYEEIQLVHQDLELHPFLTLREAIKANLSAYTDEYQEQRIEELLRLVKLEDEGHKYPREVSGGQRQRVAIAAALANEPDLLLLDEPFSNLDPFTKAGLLQHIKQEAKDLGTTVIMVTHDTKDALIFGDQIFVLRDGHIIQRGSPQQIYYKPADEKVANFFGMINILNSKDFQELWSIPPTKKGKIGIRPEALKTSEEGLEVNVLSSVFYGDRFVHKAEVGGLELLFYSDENLVRGDKAFLKLDEGRIIYL